MSRTLEEEIDEEEIGVPCVAFTNKITQMAAGVARRLCKQLTKSYYSIVL